MPNHITNILTITAPEGKQADEVLSFIRTEESEFDFETIIPETQDVKDSYDTPGVTPLWYDWRIKNWGTKWGAYDITVEGNKITFDTAWSHPKPVIEKLASMFPDFTFDVKYADEDYGFNFGHITYSKEGTMHHKMPDKGTPAANIWVRDNVLGPREWIDEQGNYIGE